MEPATQPITGTVHELIERAALMVVHASADTTPSRTRAELRVAILRVLADVEERATIDAAGRSNLTIFGAMMIGAFVGLVIAWSVL